MKVVHHFAAAVALIAATLTAPAARAGEDARLGLSLDGFVAPTWDRSVTNQQNGQAYKGSRSAAGVTAIVNLGDYALGGVVDGFPGFVGDGRLTVGGVAGWQPRAGTHRLQVLGELGRECFSDVGGSFLSTPSTAETWLDYVGARLGVTDAFSRNGVFQLGAWLFVRKDLGEANVSNTQSGLGWGDPVTTSYVVGGYSAGVAFRIGLRFDQQRRPPESPADAENEVTTKS